MTKPSWRAIVALAIAGGALLPCCGVTAGGGSLDPCNETIPAPCGDVAHCVLASDEYLQGTFPGMQTFIIRIAAPTMVTFSFQFTNRISAGTTLALTSTEPDCSQSSTYMNPGDIFKLAGAAGILSFPITMTEVGDHLIQFNSDSYCSYELSYDQPNGASSQSAPSP
jgi:hypothetical protein